MAKTADQKRSNRYSLTQVKKNLEEKVGDAVIELTLDDSENAEVFRIEHPFFRSDATKEALEPLEDDDEKGIAKVLLNALDPKGWEKFEAAGGESSGITQLVITLGMETNEALSQNRPTKR